MSARDALNKYLTRQLPKERKPKRSNARPEFEVKKLVMRWLEQSGFSCDAVESKAVYSHAAGSYVRGQAVAGFSDIVGVCNFGGAACYIELKAPGKRSSLKEHQRDFLVHKLHLYAFAVCIDSVDDLADIYSRWIRFYRLGQLQEARSTLMRHLPKAKVRECLDLDSSSE